MSTISLRALEPEDIDDLYKWENNTDVWRVSNTLVPFSKYILKKYIESSHLDIYQTKQLRLMIVVNDNDNTKTIGTIDLFDFDPYHNRAGVGILIGDNNERNKGYASKALSKLIEYCFETLKLNQLYCNIAEDNQISLKLFGKHGFEIIGLKKQWLKYSNGYNNEYLLQLLKIDYAKPK